MPCIAVFIDDPRTSLCFGRGRALMALLPQRMEEARLRPMVTDPERE
jgi:hypothetical protein